MPYCGRKGSAAGCIMPPERRVFVPAALTMTRTPRAPQVIA